MPGFDKKLGDMTQDMHRPSAHLAVLLRDAQRCRTLFVHAGGLHLDLSRQRLTLPTLEVLLDMARCRKVRQHFRHMMQGGIVNLTEKKAAVHTAARDFRTPVYLDGKNITRDLAETHERIGSFVEGIHSGKIRGSTGAPFTSLLVLGIGGSRLGTEAVWEALGAHYRPSMELRFLSTVDPNAFFQVTRGLDPAQTLVLVVSKSFTTKEVHVNLGQVRQWLEFSGLHAPGHLVAIAAQGSAGEKAASDWLGFFPLHPAIGGRYSVTSAVGTLPLSLVYGSETVEAFLDGCREMDIHSAEASEAANLPLLAALCDVWNGDYLGYPAFVMIPYAAPLKTIPVHMQQLYMESLGKAYRIDAPPLTSMSMLCFGDTGTDAQHSFFQMLHQGRSAPLDFIGVLAPPPGMPAVRDGLTPHEELWSHLLAQADAFAMGRTEGRPEQLCPGNRPSSILTLDSLRAGDIGRLLAFLEARTIYAGFLKGINPFDQFGVENGKKFNAILCTAMREKKLPQNPGTTGWYCEVLREGLSVGERNTAESSPAA